MYTLLDNPIYPVLLGDSREYGISIHVYLHIILFMGEREGKGIVPVEDD